MEARVAALIQIFHSLTIDERREAIEKLNEYIDADYEGRQRILRESEMDRIAKRVDLGPVGRACPYCGRSL